MPIGAVPGERIPKRRIPIAVLDSDFTERRYAVHDLDARPEECAGQQRVRCRRGGRVQVQHPTTHTEIRFDPPGAPAQAEEHIEIGAVLGRLERSTESCGHLEPVVRDGGTQREPR